MRIHLSGVKKSVSHRRKLSDSNKGKHFGLLGRKWYNNGKVSVIRFNCPDGFVVGRI